MAKKLTGSFRFGITRIVQEELGISMNQFCKEELKTEYRTFLARLNKGNLYPSEIVYIVWRTKKTVKELFQKEWDDLLILSQGGELVTQVKTMMKNWTHDEKEEILNLMGVEFNFAPKKKDFEEQKETNTPEIPEVKEEVKKELKDLFEETY